MKILIGLMLISISSSIYADVSDISVRFINGISLKNKCVDESCAKQSTSALKVILQEEVDSELDVQLSYNKNEKYLKDTYEAIIQGVKGDVGLKKLSSFFHDNLSPESYSNFVKAKQQQYPIEVWEHALKKEFFGEALSAQNQFNTPSIGGIWLMLSLNISLLYLIFDKVNYCAENSTAYK